MHGGVLAVPGFLVLVWVCVACHLEHSAEGRREVKEDKLHSLNDEMKQKQSRFRVERVGVRPGDRHAIAIATYRSHLERRCNIAFCQ